MHTFCACQAHLAQLQCPQLSCSRLCCLPQSTVSRQPCRFINGMKAQHTPLKEARIIFYGAGSSAVGVATMIAQLISKETGIPFDEAKKVAIPALQLLSSWCMI